MLTISGTNNIIITFRWVKCYITFILWVLLTINLDDKKEAGTPTTLHMMMPFFQTFSSGLRCTHTLSPGSKFTLLVLDELSEGCHSATISGSLLCITGRFDANLQPKNNSAGLNLDFIHSKGVVLYVVPPQSWGDRSDTKHSKCLLLGGRRLNQLTLIPKPKGSGGARATTAQVGPANERNGTKRCLPVEALLRPGEAVPW